MSRTYDIEHPTPAETKRIVRAATRFLKVIDDITTEDFSKGAERLEREELRQALSALEGASK